MPEYYNRPDARQIPSLWKLGPPASSSSAPASIVLQKCANMVSVPTQSASRAVIQAVCIGRVVRYAAPSMSCALQRDLSILVSQHPFLPAKARQSVQRSKRGLTTTAAEGNGAGPASTGLSIDLRGDGVRSVCMHIDCPRIHISSFPDFLSSLQARRPSSQESLTIRQAGLTA